jgi:hypothetical protein
MQPDRDVWRYRPGLEVSTDLTGFSVTGPDGAVGVVWECVTEVTGTYLVVDAGRWIHTTRIMLPGSVIDRLDYPGRTVYVNRDRDAMRKAPEFDPESYRSEAYRRRLGAYYTNGTATEKGESCAPNRTFGGIARVSTLRTT